MEIKINNINLYYEEYGSGQPIILLHGNQETHEIFDKLINKLKDNYKVYAIDSRCHGKSENPKEISYNLMCDDVIQFIKSLNIEKPILYGFSDGGIIGILVAIKEPNLLSKLIVSGANITPDVFTTFDFIITKLFYFFTRSKYIKMMLDEPNIPLDNLHKITIPVHVLAGEKDVIKLEHTKLIADNIENSTMEIIPKEKHGSYIIHSEKIYEIIKKYLKDNNLNELMDVYDENKTKTGKVVNRNNKKSLSNGEYTISVHCFIINSQKQILLTRRNMSKNRGGKWEDTHGGLKSGETSINGIIRELKEEIGINVKQGELKLYTTLKRENVFRDIYILFKDIPISSYSFNDNEVMDCKYVNIEEFKEMIEKGECTFKNFEDTIFYNSNILDF